MLRDFSWNYFASTGDIHAYLLYREHHDTPRALEDETPDIGPKEQGESQVCL